MVIFRENSEDIYAGVEFESGSADAKKLSEFLVNELNIKKIRFPETSGLGVKPISKEVLTDWSTRHFNTLLITIKALSR